MQQSFTYSLLQCEKTHNKTTSQSIFNSIKANGSGLVGQHRSPNASSFYVHLCLSSFSTDTNSSEGLIRLMRGLRGLLVVRTFNTHLFASTFSFHACLFGFPFSLAVAPEPKPGLYYLPIYTNRSLQCRRVNIYGAIAQDFGGTWPNCC